MSNSLVDYDLLVQSSKENLQRLALYLEIELQPHWNKKQIALKLLSAILKHRLLQNIGEIK